MRVDFDEVGNIEEELREAGSRLDQEITKEMGIIGLIVEDDARKNAPISPSKSQYVATLKRGWSNRTFQPMTLMNSISHKVLFRGVEIFTNQSSREYAWRMHEGKYNLGVGSQSKQARGSNLVGRKYIERAIKDNSKIISKKLREAAIRAHE